VDLTSPRPGDPELDDAALLELALDSAEASHTAHDGAPDDLPEALGNRITSRRARNAADGRPRRHPGWVQDEGTGFTPLDALARTAAELGEVLDTLDHREWTRPTAMAEVGVRQVAEHLVGVQRYLLGQLGRRDPLVAERRADHWPVGRRASADLVDASDSEVSREWWAESMALMAACAQLGPERPVSNLDLPGDVRSLVVLRTFELWTHDDDIRRALGRPLNLLDADRLGLMSRALMEALPIGTALTDQARPGRTARFHLTGTGGSTFDVPLRWGDTPGPPDIVVTVETIDLCRLASNRVRPEELATDVTGDRSLLAPALAAAGAFAAD
jgi:uncharacterized protein (TIGR03083 family)